MIRVLMTLVAVFLLTSCAAQTSMAPTDHAVSNGYVVQCPKQVTGEPWKTCQPQPFRPSMNLGQAVTDLATIPLRLPEAMINNYPAGGRVYCRSRIDKDTYRTTCY